MGCLSWDSSVLKALVPAMDAIVRNWLKGTTVSGEVFTPSGQPSVHTLNSTTSLRPDCGSTESGSDKSLIGNANVLDSSELLTVLAPGKCKNLKYSLNLLVSVYDQYADYDFFYMHFQTFSHPLLLHPFSAIIARCTLSSCDFQHMAERKTWSP